MRNKVRSKFCAYKARRAPASYVFLSCLMLSLPDQHVYDHSSLFLCDLRPLAQALKFT